MVNKVFQFVLTAVCISSAAMAATTIDFNTLTGSEITSYTEGDVTFTAVGGAGVLGSFGPNFTMGLLGSANSPHAEIRADIDGGANAVSVDLGDWNQDPDLLFLEVFSAADASLGYAELPIGGDFVGMETLTLSASGIAYAIFGARAPAIDGSSVIADNFTYSVVPAPGALLLAVMGLTCVQGLRRKKTL